MALLLAPSPRLRYAGAVARRQALGLAFIAVVSGLLALMILLYNHAFTPTAAVYLTVPRAGNQLTLPADVQLRGIEVGQVTAEQVIAHGVRLTLSMKPPMLGSIPANVSAMILPETLFGEKYVNLVLPAHPAPARLRAGDSIGLGRSALEVEQLFDNLVPFLSYVQPAQLNGTLTAFADALRGQTGSLGRNFVITDEYLKRFNTHLPALDTDLSRLGVVLGDYSAAAPDLLTTLRNFATNATVVTANQNQLAAFLSSSLGFSSTTTSVLDRNANGLITLAQDSTPILAVSQTYSSEFACLSGGLSALEPRLNQAMSGGELHITLFDDVDRGGYTYPADAPSYHPPYPLPPAECYGLPATNGTTPYNVGYPGPPSGNYPPGTNANYPPGTTPSAAAAGPATSASPAVSTSPANANLTAGQVGAVGSTAEERQLAAAVSAGGGTALTPASMGAGDVVLGPLLRGTQVQSY